MSDWSVYIVHCSDDSLYTGISCDVERRMQQHARQQGAKYFRGRRPERLVYLEPGHNRSTASQREAKIKKLRREAKWLLIDSTMNELLGQPRQLACS